MTAPIRTTRRVPTEVVRIGAQPFRVSTYQHYIALLRASRAHQASAGGGLQSLDPLKRKPISKSNFYGREFWGEGIALAYCHEATHCLLTITRAVHVARRTT